MGVYDTRVVEAPGAKLRFTVSLDRRTRRRATVDYATSDGTATAGGDYKATSGTLVFEVSERVELVVVPVLDDVIDEGNETLTLTLSNAQGLVIGDTVGYGLTAGQATAPSNGRSGPTFGADSPVRLAISGRFLRAARRVPPRVCASARARG